jgi:hypothetical protein
LARVTKAILRKAGFKGKALETAYAVMMAESGGNPRAHNPNASTGDNSYGLFQINMLGNLGPARLKQYGLKSNEDLFDPLTNARVAFRMSGGGKNWQPWSAYKNGSYQQYLKAGSSAEAPLQATVPGPPDIPAETRMTLNQIFKRAGLESVGELGNFQVGRERTPTPQQPVKPPAAKGTGLPRVKKMVSLIDYAQQLGLRVTENPYTDGAIGGHTKGSHHYQVIGSVNGKKVGRAIDVSGDPARLRAFFQYAEQFAGKGLNDLFYDPIGYSYDQGKRWDETIGGHDDHVHLSV